MRNLHVLIEVNSADLRIGAVNDALDLAELARPLGVRFSICGPLTPDFRAEAALRGIEAFEGCSRIVSRREVAQFALDVGSWVTRLARRRPDIVHLNYACYGPSLACAARLCRIPVVARAGGPFIPTNLANRWVDAYVANCRAHAEGQLASPLAEKVVVAGDLFRPARVRTTMALQRPLPAKRAGTVRLVFLGQLVERKGIHVLVDAFARVRGPAELLLIGGDWDAPGYATQVKARARAGAAASRIHFDNHRTDVGAILNTADVFVLPSFSDARPRSIIEAMSVGLPVVASAVGGIPTLVNHQQTGLLVEPGDAEQLAGALQRLIESPVLRQRFGAAGRRRAEEQCRADRTALEYVRLYCRLAGTEPPAIHPDGMIDAAVV